MAIKNREKLIQTIKEDCLISNNYLLDGQTCAIGGLAKAAGFDLEGYFADMDDHDKVITNETFIWSPDMHDMAYAIEAEFGLDVITQTEIQKANDRYDTPEERQEAILEIIALL